MESNQYAIPESGLFPNSSKFLLQSPKATKNISLELTSKQIKSQKSIQSFEEVYQQVLKHRTSIQKLPKLQQNQENSREQEIKQMMEGISKMKDFFEQRNMIYVQQTYAKIEQLMWSDEQIVDREIIFTVLKQKNM